MVYESALLTIRDNLQNSLAVLEEYKTKSPILKANHEAIVKGSKNYRDIISKLAHLASWGDISGTIVGLVNAVTSKTHTEFPNKLKSVSSNVVLAGATKGPIQGKLLSTRLHDNTWYNVLKKTIEIAIRSNQHAINEVERLTTAAVEKAAQKTKKLTAVTIEEEDVFKIVVDDVPDSWDD